MQKVVVSQPRLYVNEEDAPLNGNFAENVVVPLPRANEKFPSVAWTLLLRDHPYEFVQFYRQRFGGNCSDLSGKEVSNWIFLYRIQLEQGWYVNMEDVLSSMLEYAWNVVRARKVWGRYSYQDPEHVRLWVWVNYRTRARITFHHLHGDLPCGARYDCVGHARMRLKARQGKPIFERLMRGGEHDDGITFYMFA